MFAIMPSPSLFSCKLNCLHVCLLLKSTYIISVQIHIYIYLGQIDGNLQIHLHDMWGPQIRFTVLPQLLSYIVIYML